MASHLIGTLQKMNCFLDNTNTFTRIAVLRFSIEEAHRKLTNAYVFIIYIIDSHAHIL